MKFTSAALAICPLLWTRNVVHAELFITCITAPDANDPSVNVVSDPLDTPSPNAAPTCEPVHAAVLAMMENCVQNAPGISGTQISSHLTGYEFVSTNWRDWRSNNYANEVTAQPLSTTASSSATTERPSPAPSLLASEHPSSFSSQSPSEAPTTVPTKSPTDAPTNAPSHNPTPLASGQPTLSARPSAAPAESPSQGPSDHPTTYPSQNPTNVASENPTALASGQPTVSPGPSNAPTEAPSQGPSDVQTTAPSHHPTSVASVNPTALVSGQPTDSTEPSKFPTESPSQGPSDDPTTAPSHYPTTTASVHPTALASGQPTVSAGPSEAPSGSPTQSPSGHPTQHPTGAPNKFNGPSQAPSSVPTSQTTPTLLRRRRVRGEAEFDRNDFARRQLGKGNGCGLCYATNLSAGQMMACCLVCGMYCGSPTGGKRRRNRELQATANPNIFSHTSAPLATTSTDSTNFDVNAYADAFVAQYLKPITQECTIEFQNLAASYLNTDAYVCLGNPQHVFCHSFLMVSA